VSSSRTVTGSPGASSRWGTYSETGSSTEGVVLGELHDRDGGQRLGAGADAEEGVGGGGLVAFEVPGAEPLGVQRPVGVDDRHRGAGDALVAEPLGDERFDCRSLGRG